MKQKRYNVLGIMSGTSLDGIDCAFITIEYNQKIKATINIAETISYPTSWRTKLKGAYKYSLDELSILDIDYTQYLGDVLNTFIAKHKLENLDAICSHGHTILHQPDRGYTLQIGNLPELSQIVNNKVVCDFRVQDVALGGQGAPLVPIGDQLLFSQYDYCLNLGGFANLSSVLNDKRIAYDICPVNVVLNNYAQILGSEYDKDGAFAKAGKSHAPLLKELNSLNFYSELPPKSLGIEWVHQYIFPIIDKYSVSPEVVLSTFTEHIGIQLATQFQEGESVLVTGGGAFNKYLLECILTHKNVNIILPENSLVEFKEALIFALLGVLRLEGEINVLASVTGATNDHCAGLIYEC